MTVEAMKPLFEVLLDDEVLVRDDDFTKTWASADGQEVNTGHGIFIHFYMSRGSATDIYCYRVNVYFFFCSS